MNDRRSSPRAASVLSGCEPRRHALDALRAAAMFSVIVSHSSLAYVRDEVPGLLWAVHDRSTSVAFDLLFHATRVAVPLFFALAGFFAALLYEARGPAGFLADRARRILVPLLVGLLTILPLSLWVWAYGWSRSGRCTEFQFLRMVFLDPEIRANRYGPGHLWFLEHLCIYLGGYFLVRRLAGYPGGLPDARRGEARFFSPAMPLLLALPTAAVLWLSHEPNGRDALLDRRNTFLPGPYGLVFYGFFFAFGARLHRFRAGMERLSRGRGVLLAAALVAFALRWPLLRWDLAGGLPAAWVPVGSLLGALTCWLSLYALLGVAMTCMRGEVRAVRYLADASYWVYWSHFPIVGLMQIHLRLMPIAPELKFLAVMGVTLGWCLASYQVLVRHTALGRWLHGPRGRGFARPAAAAGCPGSGRLSISTRRAGNWSAR